MVEITVRVSNDEQRFTQKFLSYEEHVGCSKSDPILSPMVEEAIKNFKGTVEEVHVKLTMIW